MTIPQDVPSITQLIIAGRYSAMSTVTVKHTQTYTYTLTGIYHCVSVDSVIAHDLSDQKVSNNTEMDIFIAGCTGSYNFNNFQCNQSLKFHQNDINYFTLIRNPHGIVNVPYILLKSQPDPARFDRDANFVITSDNGVCCHDKLRCHQWQRSRHRDKDSSLKTVFSA